MRDYLYQKTCKGRIVTKITHGVLAKLKLKNCKEKNIICIEIWNLVNI